MAKINVESGGAAPLSTGELQLNNGVAMSTTLTAVTDQNNTASQLKLASNLTQVAGTLQVALDGGSYIDAQDTSGIDRFNVNRSSGSQQVNIDMASKPSDITTVVGAIRTYQDGVNLSEAVKFQENGQTTFTERLKVEADSTVTTQSSSVISADTTNASLVIAPNGTGALIADIPDGAIAGGNARGANAVDLQTSRGAATNVASGQNSTISGGSTNTASSNYSTVSGGQSNTASTNTHATVVGGLLNTASGPRATVGGESSTSSGQVSTAFGYQATANGYGAVYLGFQGTSSGSYSFSGGVGHTSSARSTVCLGESNTANTQSAIALGTQSKAYLFGQKSIANGNFTAVGDAQQSQTTSRKEATLTTGGTTVVWLDGGAGPSNSLIPDGNNRSWNVQVRWVAVVTAITGTATGVTVGDTKVSTDLLAVAKLGGVTTVGVHTSAATSTIETIAGSLTAVNITYTAGVFGQMQINFTGPTFAGGGSVTMRVVAATSITEVAY